jgi:toxin ParE1/3/4
MARFHISRLARADLARILASSLERWGEDGRERYAALLVAAMRTVARSPLGPTTRERAELGPGLRSFRSWHARHRAGVRDPVHVIYYRLATSAIEIVRVLHERMEPSSQLRIEPHRTKRKRK